jgi:hypothetical protein
MVQEGDELGFDFKLYTTKIFFGSKDSTIEIAVFSDLGVAMNQTQILHYDTSS